jgi:predicted dehydrogenase
VGGSQLRTAVLDAGRWARLALILDPQRNRRCKIVTICETNLELAQDRADQFDIPGWASDWQAVTSRTGIDAIDVVTPSHPPFKLGRAALEAGRHVER